MTPELERGAGSHAPRSAGVASLAGVSRKTVSRVLNNEPYVSDTARRRVLEAAEAVSAAEQKLLTALGQATTLEDEERAETARQMLQEQALALRNAAEELSAWLDAPRT